MSDCYRYLILDSSVATFDEKGQAAWMSLITQDTYNQNSAQIDADVEALGISWFGEASGGWKRFDETRTHFLETGNYNYSSQQASSVVTQKVSDNTLKAVQACFKAEAEAGTARGIVLLKKNESPFSVSILVWWNQGTQSAVPGLHSISSSVTGGTVANAAPGTLFPNGTQFSAGDEKIVTITRNGNSDIEYWASVLSDAQSDVSVFVPASETVTAYVLQAGYVGPNPAFDDLYTHVDPGFPSPDNLVFVFRITIAGTARFSVSYASAVSRPVDVNIYTYDPNPALWVSLASYPLVLGDVTGGDYRANLQTVLVGQPLAVNPGSYVIQIRGHGDQMTSPNRQWEIPHIDGVTVKVTP